MAEQNRNIFRSGICQDHIRGLGGRKLFTVVTETPGADGDLASFIGAQRDRRWCYLNEVSIVLILQDCKCVGLRIVKNDRQIGESAAGEAICNQGGWIGANGEASLRENCGARQSRQSAVPHTSGEQRQRNGIAIADEKAGGRSILRAQQHLAPALNQRGRIGEIASAAGKGGQKRREATADGDSGRYAGESLPREDLLNVGEEIRQLCRRIELIQVVAIETDELL